jgi:hypothetical protein
LDIQGLKQPVLLSYYAVQVHLDAAYLFMFFFFTANLLFRTVAVLVA